MKLKVLDRLAVVSVLPVQGNFITLSVATEIRDKIKFGDAERQRLSLNVAPNGGMGWNPAADVTVEFVFTDTEKTLIKKALRDLVAANQLNADHLGAFKLFVLEENAK